MKSYKSSYKRLLELGQEAGVRIVRRGEKERCAIWVEAGLAGISAAGLRGISAVIAMASEWSGVCDTTAGRERTMKKSVIK